MSRYRRKPLVAEAVEWPGFAAGEATHSQEAVGMVGVIVERRNSEEPGGKLIVARHNGLEIGPAIGPGQWIVRVEGQLPKVLKAHEFSYEYEPVDPEEPE